MSLVLEHVRDPWDVLRRIYQLLRPGGVLWVEVPNDFNPLQQVIVTNLEKPRWWVVPEHHLNYFNFETLSKTLAHLGFIEQKRSTSFPMELFVLMGCDYIGNDQVGSKAHSMRMNLENHLLATHPQLLDDLYQALASKGLGRTCNILVQKPTTRAPRG